MARRTFSGARRRSPTRKFVWARSINEGSSSTTTANDFDLLAPFETQGMSQVIGATVTRIRLAGTFHWAATLPDMAVMGIRVVDDNTNLTVASAPKDSPHSDWMFYQPVTGWLDTNANFALSQFEYDVRSQRKIEELGQGLRLVVSDTILGNVDYRISVSVGLKLA